VLKRREWRTLDHKTWSVIEYKLTLWEYIQERYAMFRACTSFGKCQADFMSADLEDLLCMYVPERHTVVVPFVEYVDDN